MNIKFFKQLILTVILGGGLVIPIHPLLVRFLSNLHF